MNKNDTAKCREESLVNRQLFTLKLVAEPRMEGGNVVVYVDDYEHKQAIMEL